MNYDLSDKICHWSGHIFYVKILHHFVTGPKMQQTKINRDTITAKTNQNQNKSLQWDKKHETY